MHYTLAVVVRGQHIRPRPPASLRITRLDDSSQRMCAARKMRCQAQLSLIVVSAALVAVKELYIHYLHETCRASAHIYMQHMNVVLCKDVVDYLPFAVDRYVT